MKVFASILILFTVPLVLQAQSDKALFKKYEYGKSLLNNNQYRQAYEVFKSLSAIELENRYRDHALYFYALTAFQTGKENESRNALFELLRKAPDWEAKDDVYFLIGTIEMNKRNFASALDNFSKVKSEAFADQILVQLDKGLKEVSVDDLEFLYKKYEYDILGKKLYEALQEVNIYPTYETLYEELIPKYGNNEGQDSTLVGESIQYKEAYNIAIMLPFRYDEFDTDSVPGSQQRVFDLYQGMNIAAEDLKKEGIELKLFAFDTKNDSVTTRAILSDSTFSKMDLIIGPLYSKNISLVGDYAGLFKKVMVNPVSINESIINGNPFAFLTLPTNKSQAEIVANYALDSLGSKKTYIIYGLSKLEEDAAFHYGEYFQDRGGEVAMFKQFEYDKKFFQSLQESLMPLAEDSIPHVFVSASDQAVASNVISALQNLQAKNKIFAPSSWLNFEQFSFEQLEKMGVHFMHPRYFDEDGINYKKFRSDYVKKMNLIPSLYACLGYETLYYFGKLLNEFGTGLSSKIHESGIVKGKIFSSFDYSKGNDNAYVPLLKFEEGKLLQVNSYFEVDRMTKELTVEKKD